MRYFCLSCRDEGREYEFTAPDDVSEARLAELAHDRLEQPELFGLLPVRHFAPGAAHVLWELDGPGGRPLRARDGQIFPRVIPSRMPVWKATPQEIARARGSYDVDNIRLVDDAAAIRVRADQGSPGCWVEAWLWLPESAGEAPQEFTKDQLIEDLVGACGAAYAYIAQQDRREYDSGGAELARLQAALQRATGNCPCRLCGEVTKPLHTDGCCPDCHAEAHS
jgi:hypothetical protein